MRTEGAALLRTLLDDAVSVETFAASRASEKRPAGSAGDRSGQPRQSASTAPSDVRDGIAVINFLLERNALDLGEYMAWHRLAIAFKNSFGEDGFAPWLAFSEAAPGFESEEACRKEWDGIKPRKDGPPLTIATYIAQAKGLGFSAIRAGRGGQRGGEGPDNDGSPGPDRSNDGSGSDDTDSLGQGGSAGRADPAAITLDLVADSDDELWVDQENKPHVTYGAELPDGSTVRRHVPVDSGTYKDVLRNRYHKHAKTKVLKKDQADSVVEMLQFRAREANVRHTAVLRVGMFEERIYVDLGTPDGSAVEISAEGWQVVNDPPVRFVRGSRSELVAPEPGGTLAEFERHFNLGQEDLQRLLAFMIGTFNVGASFPILMVDGEQGSGKSSLADKVVGLIDPPHQMKSGRMSFNPKEQDLHIGALGVHLLYFDNVSTFSADAADALCRISTGGGSGSRKLYTNDQFNQHVVMRPLVLTCIGAPSSRPDLLDRSVRVTALTLEGHKSERSVIAAYKADRPKMLGFIYSCVSAALRNRFMVEEAVERGDFRLPRMADFAEFVEGAGEMLGLPLGGFSGLLTEGQSAMQIETVIGHPVGAGLIKYFSRAGVGELNAPARDIISALRDLSSGDQRWPAANMLGKALNRLSVGLRHLGIEWEAREPEAHANVARYRIWTTEKFVPQDKHDDGSGGGHF